MRWYKDDIIEGNRDEVWQQSYITLCVDSTQNQNIDEYQIHDFGYMKRIRSPDIYTPILQEINDNRRKYGRAQGIMRKVLDLALATNSYDELIGICQSFILDKQQKQESENVEFDIGNPIITTWKERPPRRAKSTIEIQDKQSRKRRYLQPIEVNETKNMDNKLNEKDTHKTYQNCEQKRHNRATCNKKEWMHITLQLLIKNHIK